MESSDSDKSLDVVSMLPLQLYCMNFIFFALTYTPTLAAASSKLCNSLVAQAIESDKTARSSGQRVKPTSLDRSNVVLRT